MESTIQEKFEEIFYLIRIKWKITILALSLLGLIISSTFWLTIIIFFSVVIYWMGFTIINKIKYKVGRKITRGFFFIFILINSGVIIKLLIGDIYRIPSNSMEDTLFSEDIILVNKLVYGPKLPRSPYSIFYVKFFCYLNNINLLNVDTDWWPYKRLNGNGEINQGDVMVYELSRNFFVVKRCVGKAGDNLYVNDGNIYVNGKVYLEPSTVKNVYRLFLNDQKRFYKQIDSMGLELSIYPDGGISGGQKANLSYIEKKKLENLSGVRITEKVLDTFDQKKDLFVASTNFKWTLDNMGPINVPEKGMKIRINQLTYMLYGKVLREHEGIYLENRADGYYNSDGEKVTTHTFKQDYYFVMGDNRKSAIDSRFTGFVPEKNIVGKVCYILFSNYQQRFRSKRLLKRI